MIARLAPGVDPSRRGGGGGGVPPARAGTARGHAVGRRHAHHARAAGRGLSQLRSSMSGRCSRSRPRRRRAPHPCTNVGNLPVLRHAGRRRELAVRWRWEPGARPGPDAWSRACCWPCSEARWRWWSRLGSCRYFASTLPVPATPTAWRFAPTRGCWRSRRASRWSARSSSASFPRGGPLGADLSSCCDEPRSRRHAAQPASRALAMACQVALSVLLLCGRGPLRADAAQPDACRRRVSSPTDCCRSSIDTRGAGYGPGQVGAAAPAARSRRGRPGRPIRHGHPERRDAVGGDAIPRDAARPCARAGRRVEWRRRSGPGLLRDDGHPGSGAGAPCRGLRTRPAAGGRHRGLGAPLLPWRESGRRPHRRRAAA